MHTVDLCPEDDEVVLSPRPRPREARGKVDMASSSSSSLSARQLWASLPNPCKIFLGLCVVQACTMGSFASIELVKEGTSNYQDLIMLLVSSVMFLCIVVDAFWHENAYQLLVSMASGGLNLAQLVIYATSLSVRVGWLRAMGRGPRAMRHACSDVRDATMCCVSHWFGYRRFPCTIGGEGHCVHNGSMRLRSAAVDPIGVDEMGVPWVWMANVLEAGGGHAAAEHRADEERESSAGPVPGTGED